MTGPVSGALRDNSDLRLFCLAHAGGSASVFRHWRRDLPGGVEIVPLEMRGRGSRFAAPPFGRLDEIVAEMTDAIAAAADRPFALFGHSMGAITGLEVARRLDAAKLAPRWLFVSGHRAPHLRSGDGARHALAEDLLIAHLRRLGGPGASALDDDEIVRVMLPIVRLDLAAYEQHLYRPAPPLSCGITAFGGLDDPLARPDQIVEWRRHTVGGFRFEMFPGAHFFFAERPADLLASMCGDLRRCGTLGTP